MIDLEYNEVVNVERLEFVGDTNKKNFQVSLEGIKCCVQPLESQFSQDTQGGFGKDFLMFCETADIVEGDRIVRNPDESGGGDIYRITAIDKFSFRGRSHMEVQIRIFES